MNTTTQYQGYSPGNRRFQRFYSGTESRNNRYNSFDPEKLIHKHCHMCKMETPINKVCDTCGMNNIGVMQQINKIHTTNPNHCCFRGPAFNPYQKIRQRTLQYNAKHGQIPLQYGTENNVLIPQTMPNTANATLSNMTSENPPMDDEHMSSHTPDDESPLVSSVNNNPDDHTYTDDHTYYYPYCRMTTHEEDHDHNDSSLDIPLPGSDITSINLWLLCTLEN